MTDVGESELAEAAHTRSERMLGMPSGAVEAFMEAAQLESPLHARERHSLTLDIGEADSALTAKRPSPPKRSPSPDALLPPWRSGVATSAPSSPSGSVGRARSQSKVPALPTEPVAATAVDGQPRGAARAALRRTSGAPQQMRPTPFVPFAPHVPNGLGSTGAKAAAKTRR
eukprot:gnl/TRDRNA2_/TRDRNA2_83096_c0_seq1.p1 gnl/TRDRNA2_/TRDRNA2_83096_c0~~gnl/TRDRNA2_/TRDRNA2_83096_c0_seq1.p1  ORF type:complete len:200 (+),score=26.77 gnl/TRDRNA2_/TRDRNA2_83096_c0_seq1:89-601(+)